MNLASDRIKVWYSSRCTYTAFSSVNQLLIREKNRTRVCLKINDKRPQHGIEPSPRASGGISHYCQVITCLQCYIGEDYYELQSP